MVILLITWLCRDKKATLASLFVKCTRADMRLNNLLSRARPKYLFDSQYDYHAMCKPAFDHLDPFLM